MTTLIGSIFVFLLVITLHEFGHFIAAKLSGIKVNEFAVGMGPKLFGKKKGETLYSLRALPIGGFCAMEGESEDSEDPRSFQKAPLKNRFFVVVAGASMNFILAIVAFTFAFLLLGSQTTTIAEISKDSPAFVAGLQKGDVITKINHSSIQSWEDILENIGNSKGEISLTVKRGDKDLSFSLTPKVVEGRKIIGIIAETEHHFGSALSSGLLATKEVIKSIFTVFHMMFQRTFETKMLAGPVGVISMIGESTKAGFAPLLFILGAISANLGVVNLLPIPALDGGKVLFLTLELLRGKPVSEEKEGIITVIGMAFLMGLMVYITIFADLKRLLAG